jgi:hypothetical protein
MIKCDITDIGMNGCVYYKCGLGTNVNVMDVLNGGFLVDMR